MSEWQPREERIRQYRVRQPIAELERKQRKAAQRGIWTQEDLDLADARAEQQAWWFRKLSRTEENAG
jgi:hypothetical protein